MARSELSQSATSIKERRRRRRRYRRPSFIDDHEYRKNESPFNTCHTISLLLLVMYHLVVIIPLIWSGVFASIYSDESAPSILPEFYDLTNTKGQVTNLTVYTKNSIGSMIIRANTLVEFARRFCNKGKCSLQSTKPDD